MPKVSDLRVSTDLVEGGEWHAMNYDCRGPVTDTDDESKLYFLIGSNLSSRYRDAVREVLVSKGITDEQEMRIAAKAFLIGWKNYEDDDGNAVEYSEDAAYQMLLDPEYIDARQYVMSQAQNRERVRHKRREALRKNSETA